MSTASSDDFFDDGSGKEEVGVEDRKRGGGAREISDEGRSDVGASDEGRSDVGASDEGRSDVGASDEGRSDVGASDEERVSGNDQLDVSNVRSGEDYSDSELEEEIEGELTENESEGEEGEVIKHYQSDESNDDGESDRSCERKASENERCKKNYHTNKIVDGDEERGKLREQFDQGLGAEGKVPASTSSSAFSFSSLSSSREKERGASAKKGKLGLTVTISAGGGAAPPARRPPSSPSLGLAHHRGQSGLPAAGRPSSSCSSSPSPRPSSSPQHASLPQSSPSSASSLLVVRKSAMHDRPGRTSPRATPPPSPHARGINKAIARREITCGRDGGGAEGPMPSAGCQPRIIDRVAARDQPRHRPLGKYTRSLRMLGVKIPPPVPPDPRGGRSSSSQSWQGRGKVHTRLERRSTSLEDVRRAIPQVQTPHTLHTLRVDEGQRATLSQAVYEEWYFSKCKMLRAQKVQARERVRAQEQECLRVKQDTQQKVAAAMTQWEEGKARKKQQERERKREEERKKEEKAKEEEEQQMRVSAALVSWHTQKEELRRKRRERRKGEKEAKKEEERKQSVKKADSEQVFLKWKEMKLEEEKEKRRKRRQEEEERKQKEQEEWRQKRSDADSAFAAWRRSKTEEERNATKKVVVRSSVEGMQGSKEAEARAWAASQAYEDWLDRVEEREPVRLYEDARSSLLAQTRPPWWPGGSSSSLVGC